MKTLLINAHPDFTKSTHFSSQLQKKFVSLFNEQFPAEELSILNLYGTEIPRIEEGQLLSIWDKQATGENLSEGEQKIAQQSAKLLAQLKAHHRLVIVSPLHNFNVTSRMKDYIDNILIARETFKYTDTPDEKGKVSMGLLTNDYKALLLFSSGSIYTKNDFYRAVDFAPQYLEMIFSEIMGFDHFDIVRAEGTAVLPKEEILSTAMSNLEKAFLSLYSN